MHPCLHLRLDPASTTQRPPVGVASGTSRSEPATRTQSLFSSKPRQVGLQVLRPQITLARLVPKDDGEAHPWQALGLGLVLWRQPLA